VTTLTGLPPVSPALMAKLTAERARVNAALAAVAEQAVDGAPAALAEPMRYALATPGKRIRPILCASAWRAFRPGDAPDAVYRMAAAVEIVHTYSLVHDDLPCMDDDPMRRGRPAAHAQFGTARAMLAGAALIPAAVRVLDAAAAELGLKAATRGALVVELSRAGGAAGMVGGQLLDLESEGRPATSALLERIHRRKTGALLVAALRIGALAAGAADRALAAISAYGDHVGLAFQIVDDVLDVTGDEASLGKTAGKDESTGKTTYPALFGIDGAQALASSLVSDAVAALHDGGIHSPELEAIARYVVERTS
jgi:farnesyl diphosphate synthase